MLAAQMRRRRAANKAAKASSSNNNLAASTPTTVSAPTTAFATAQLNPQFVTTTLKVTESVAVADVASSSSLDEPFKENAASQREILQPYDPWRYVYCLARTARSTEGEAGERGR